MEAGAIVMNQVWITDAAAVTSLGGDIDETWINILSGKSGIGKLNRFPCHNYVSDLAACINFIDAPSDDSFLKAIAGHLVSHLSVVPGDALLFTATTKSCIDNLEKIQRGMDLSPLDVPCSSIPRFISERLGLADRGININAACASSTIALIQACTAIASGRTQCALVCGLDMVSEFVFAGFSSIGAMSPSPARPFDPAAKGMTLGEGGAALLLMSRDRAEKENRLPLTGICGWGIANDAAHITAPARDGSGLIKAVQKALGTASINPQDIGAVSAHGTGTVYNDAMELTAFKHIFAQQIPLVNSIKGAIGHTLGAAGAIEAALGIYMLEKQLLLPTAGFQVSHEGVQNIVNNVPMPFAGDYLLSTNSGFGGINAAIIMSKAGSK